jgi:hypothetical protein
MKTLGTLLAALVALEAQAPAAPVRHLEYAFATYPTAKPNGDYYDGTLSVDILGKAPDGGTLVRAREWYYFALRPQQSIECEVYGGGTVHCDDLVPSPSAAETVLFPLLDGNFFDAGSSTSASTWQQKFEFSIAKGLYVTSATTQFKPAPQTDARALLLTSSGTLQQLSGEQRKSVQQEQVLYDPAASIPLVVHDVRGPLPARNVYERTSVDLQLTKDSAQTTADILALEHLGQVQYQINDELVSGIPASARVPSPTATGIPSAFLPR